MNGTAQRKVLPDSLSRVIFGADSAGGRAYDMGHIAVILTSVAVTMATSVAALNAVHGTLLHTVEWVLTGLLTLDYCLRLFSVRNRLKYARSFFGVVDLVSVLPTYLSFIVPGSQFLSTVRFLRILRVFRVFNLSSYHDEMQALFSALKASRRRIVVFVFFVLVCVVVLGSLMYAIEGPENGFTSIPISIYWAIVTLTTVGYGDLSPRTPLGQLLSNVIMLLGYSIIVIPTGIVATSGRGGTRPDGPSCPECGAAGHQTDAVFCRKCGKRLGYADRTKG